MDKKIWDLFQALSEKEYKSSYTLAGELQLSYKTIRMRAKELDCILQKNGAVIESKPHKGYILKITNRQAYEGFACEEEKPRSSYCFSNPEDRIYFLVEYLLSSDQFIKMDELCTILYVSKNTLTSDLKKAEYLLKDFDITLERRPNYGIRVVGSEWNRRLSITHYLVQDNRFCFEPPECIEESTLRIGKCILNAMHANKSYISEMLFENLVLHIYTVIQRIRQGHLLPDDIAKEPSLQSRPEIQALAGMIVSELEKAYNLTFAPSEAAAIAISLAGSNEFSQMELRGQNFVIAQEVLDLADQMLQIVYDTFKIDLRRNLDLRMALCQEIVPLRIRLKYNMKLKNPLIEKIKQKYVFPYTLASQAFIALKQYLQPDTAVPDDEIGYFALNFALALKKESNAIAPKNILLVCASGKGSAQLLLYKLQDEFGEYIHHIQVCDLYSVREANFQTIDYVFTTVPLKEKIPVPILEIQLFPEEKEMLSVKRTLEMDNCLFLLDYYDPNLFFTNVPGETKEEVIACLCGEIRRYRELPEGFQKAVLRREELANTDYGNLIALPHPYKSITRDTFVCVGILGKPIFWVRNKVQVVILVSIADKENKRLQDFYQLTLGLITSKGAVAELIANGNFETFMRLLDENYDKE